MSPFWPSRELRPDKDERHLVAVVSLWHSHGMSPDPLPWLLDSDEPWTRYRALIDLAGHDSGDPEVRAARLDMLAHPAIVELIKTEWPGYPLKRHNDAAHPIYTIATLADFGLTRREPGIDRLASKVLAHFDGAGFETLLWLPRFLTKEKEDSEAWAWMLCDTPTLLYSLIAFGYGEEPKVRAAIAALEVRVQDNGWRCGAAESIPKFSGPGRKDDTCPIATTYSLKVMAQLPDHRETDGVASGVEALLAHWEHQKDYKLKMFGIGTDFRKLKYPFVWYDILHVADVLSRFPAARRDPRLTEMVAEISAQADPEGRYRAGSMYRAWKDWSFADKKNPSPWLTMLVQRIQRRMENPDS